MPCEEKAALLELYASAARFYSYAVGQLASATAAASIEVYQDAKRISEEAWGQCNAAFFALERHTATHQC
jgi:hypothetical protein